jgi:branched-chain amino acid transport system ATP-binding protein
LAGSETILDPLPTQPAGRSMLDVAQITTGYGRTMIVRDVSLAIATGEIVAIVGRNGVGKTTLMKAIIGLLPLARGTIAFAGANISTVPANVRAQSGIGYFPQGRGIFPGLTVEENLDMGELINAKTRGPHPLRKDIAFQYFPRLAERRQQRAGTLSGGEQAMLAIGRVLIGQPTLMLLDEPSEGLQPNLVQQIGDDIKRINDELGTTVLFVEQNIELVMNLAQRGYVMDKGQVSAALSGAEVTNQGVLIDHLAV